MQKSATAFLVIFIFFYWEEKKVIQDYSTEVTLINTQCSTLLCLWGHQQRFIWLGMCSCYVEGCSWHCTKTQGMWNTSFSKPNQKDYYHCDHLDWDQQIFQIRFKNCNKVRGIVKWEDRYQFRLGVQYRDRPGVYAAKRRLKERKVLAYVAFMKCWQSGKIKESPYIILSS